MAKTTAVWGIDVGQCGLKALRCVLDADGEVLHADKYDYIEYPKILSQPEADAPELIREALQQFLSRNDVVGDKVAISVSGQAGLSRFFKPPPVDTKTLPNIVAYEVKQQIPFPIEDVIWDWQQLGGTVVDGRAIDAEIGLFAMKRDAVLSALQPFDEADIEVDLVQLSPLAVFNVTCFDILDDIPDPEEFDPDNPPPFLVVMSMGTETTDLIVTNGIKLWLRNIPIGGNHFTRQLSREMKLTQAKAEHLKRNARQSENPKMVFKAMRPVFNDLVNEVQRSLTFFQSNEKNADISEIVLLGNAAKLPGLRQFLHKQLDINIGKVSEFRRLAGKDVTSQPSFANNILSFGPAYGLCIQGLGQGKINTNLLPPEIVVDRVIRAKKPWVLASVGAIMLGLVMGLFFKGSSLWRAQPEYTDRNGVTRAEATKKVAALKSKSSSFVTKDEELKSTLEKLKVIANELASGSSGRTAWMEVYSALFQVFPKDKKIQEAIKQGLIAVDPVEYPFGEREEIYVDHIESVYFKNLGSWFQTVQPIHESMFTVSDQEMEEATKEGASSADVEAVAGQDADASGDTSSAAPLMDKPGWVIEIQGHHFHNSRECVRCFDAGKEFVVNHMIKPMLEREDIRIPTDNDPDDLFALSDLGIFYPTITRTSKKKKRKIILDVEENQTQNGRGRGSVGRGSEDSTQDDDVPTFDVIEYSFVVQMAWTPRSTEERLEARRKRREAAQAKREAQVKAEQEADATNEQ